MIGVNEIYSNLVFVRKKQRGFLINMKEFQHTLMVANKDNDIRYVVRKTQHLFRNHGFSRSKRIRKFSSDIQPRLPDIRFRGQNNDNKLLLYFHFSRLNMSMKGCFLR